MIFDIETKVRGETEAESLEICRRAKPPKTLEELRGKQNWGDETAARRHAEYLAGYDESLLEDAALDWKTANVFAIGFMEDTGGKPDIIQDDEASLLREFWDRWWHLTLPEHLYGWNIIDFDLPFIVHRSWVLRVHTDPFIHRYNQVWDERVRDLMLRDTMGNRQAKYRSLNEVAKEFGVGQKPEGVSGADFARLWVEDRAAAEAYLANDLEMTRRIAVRMGLLYDPADDGRPF